MPLDSGDPPTDPSTDASRHNTAHRLVDGAAHDAAWVLERIADAHVTLDRGFRFTYVNAAAERALGKSRGEMLGRTHWEVFPASVDLDAGRAYRRVVAEGAEQHLTQHYVGEGYDRHLEIDAYPTEEGGVAVFWRDVTARVGAQAQTARFERLAEHSNDAQYLLEESGRIRWANRLASERTGYTFEELTALTVGDINAHLSTEAVGAYFARARRGRVAPFESVHRRKDGSTYPVEVTLTVADLPEGPRMLAAVRDITERKVAERERERLLAAERAARAEAEAAWAASEVAQREEAALVETVRRIGSALASELDLERIVQAVTDEATVLTGAQFGAFFYHTASPQGGEEMLLYTLAGVPHEHFAHFPHPRATPVFGPTFRGEGVVRSDDITADERYGRMAPHHGMPAGHLPVTSYLAVPVRSKTGQVLGGLFFGHARPGVFGVREERLAVGVAGWAAVAMDNAQLYAAEHRARSDAEDAAEQLADQALELELSNQQLQEQAAELEVQAEELQVTATQLEERTEEAERSGERATFLAESSRLLASSLDPAETLGHLADLAVPTLADWCGVDLVDEATGAIEQVAVAHADPERVAWAREVRRAYPAPLDGPTGVPAVIRTGQAEWYPEVNDAMLVASAKSPAHLDLMRGLGITSVIIAPLIARGRTLGALSLVVSTPGRRFTPDDLALAEEVGRRAGLALDNARRFEAEQAALRRAVALQRVATALAGALTASEVARVVVHHGREAVGAAAGSFFVLSGDGSAFELLASEGYDEAAARQFVRFPVVSGRPLSDAVLGNAPAYLPSLDETEARYPEMTPLLRATGYAAFAALPVRIGPGPAAALSFSFAVARAFAGDDGAFLETLAAQAGQALERARLVEAERAARADAESANRAKSLFLTTMSHELRTPLNAIAGYTELLAMGVRGPVTDAQQDDFVRIRRANQHLTGLVTDILNFARLDAGQVEFHLADVALAPVLADVEALVAPQLAAKALAYDHSGCGPQASDRPHVVRADAEKVRQVLLNLLSNAIKFTEAGGRIAVTCDVDAPAGVARVRVTDTGRGIPADQLARVFEPFVQVDRHRTHESQQGVGLGLSISRDLARGMGGELTAESTPGVGSAFTLTLPTAS